MGSCGTSKGEVIINDLVRVLRITELLKGSGEYSARNSQELGAGGSKMMRNGAVNKLFTVGIGTVIKQVN